MKRILTILAITMATSILAMGQANNKKVEEEIMKLRNELNEALRKSDVATIDRLTTDDFLLTYLIPSKIYTKAEYLELAKNPESRGFTTESQVVDEVKTHVYDGAVVVTGRTKSVRKWPDGSTSNFESRSTQVWVKQRGKWLLAARHSSPAMGVYKPE